jgi:hypothetical protein
MSLELPTHLPFSRQQTYNNDLPATRREERKGANLAVLANGEGGGGGGSQFQRLRIKSVFLY